MIEVKYSKLKDGNFTGGLHKLEHHTSFSIKLAMQVAKLTTKIREEADVAQTAFEKVVKKYAYLKEDGTIDPKGGPPGAYKIKEENMKDWEKELDEFEAMTFKVEIPKLKLTDLEGVGLSPAQLGAIDCLLNELEAVPSAAPKKAPQLTEANH